jgi:dTDP-4-dehydrorhamnose reductase
MRIGIIGAKGRLGSQLVKMGCEPLNIDITKVQDMTNLDQYNVIINCAGKTNVDACEIERHYWEAIRVNGYGILNLAGAYPNGRIIHISTDYVFGGHRGPYAENYDREDDLPTKKMAYGLTKMVGEQNALFYKNVCVVRTTGLYGGDNHKSDFVKYLLERYNTGTDEIQIAKDAFGNHTYVPHLAEALIQCAESKQIPNVLHIASKEVISRYEFALMVASVFGMDKSKLIPVRSDQVQGWLAERPKKGGLKVTLAQKLGLPIYTILEGLEASKNV